MSSIGTCQISIDTQVFRVTADINTFSDNAKILFLKLAFSHSDLPFLSEMCEESLKNMLQFCFILEI